MDLVSPLLCHNREEIEQHQGGKEKHQKRLLCKAFLVKVDGGLIWIDIKYKADALTPVRYSDNIKEGGTLLSMSKDYYRQVLNSYHAR